MFTFYSIGGLRDASVRIAVLIMLSVLALVSCAPNSGGRGFYVIIEPGNAEDWIGAITSIANENGLATNVGRATSDTGKTLTVVEARGRGVRAGSLP